MAAKTGRRVELQEGDIAIFRYLFDYQVLTLPMLLKLTGRGAGALPKRLRKLIRARYITRKQLRTTTPRAEYAYFPDRGARDALAEREIIPRSVAESRIRWQERRHEPHWLMLSELHTIFELACRQRGLTIAAWNQDRNRLAERVTVTSKKTGTRQRIPVIPDAFVTLERRDGLKRHLFIEADRATMNQKRMKRKLVGYYFYWKQNRHAESYGINGFHVLTVTKRTANPGKSWERVANLCQTARGASPGETGSGLFWFTSMNRFDLDNPAPILEAVWLTACSGPGGPLESIIGK